MKDVMVDNHDKNQFDLALLFVGQAHAANFEALVQHANRLIGSAGQNIKFVALLGGGVIGDGVEFDQINQPCMSLLMGSLPEGAEMKIVQHVNGKNVDKDASTIQQLQSSPSSFGSSSSSTTNAVEILSQLDDRFTSCLLFADPWAPVEKMLAFSSSSFSEANASRRGRTILAGGITCPVLLDQSSIAVGGTCLPQGSVVAIGFAGTLGLQTMVTQGCRPVAGSLCRVTACRQNIITELDGKPALQVLSKLANQASPRDQKQISSELLCGILAKSRATDSDNDDDDDDNNNLDFLSRQIIGFVPSAQGIAIGTIDIQVGDLFCFQVRDGNTAEQDLKLMVQRAKTERLFNADAAQPTPLAMIQISCVARGSGLFDGTPNVDVSNVQQLAPVSVAGFFANGEIGPVGLAGFFSTEQSANGNQAFLHSFTTIAVVVCELSRRNQSQSRNSLQESSVGADLDDAWG